MAAAIPYTYIQCPCTRDTHHDGDREERQDDEDSVDSSEERAGEDDDFDPHNPRANYSLYPIDHLLYCEICAQIRCQRCLVDEIVTWFCPNCLFEVPSSTVKSEGNRYVCHIPPFHPTRPFEPIANHPNSKDARDPASNVQSASPPYL